MKTSKQTGVRTKKPVVSKKIPPKKRNATSRDDFDAMKELLRVKKTSSTKRKVAPTLEDIEVMKALLKAQKKTPKKRRTKLPQTKKRSVGKGSEKLRGGKVPRKKVAKQRSTGGKVPRKVVKKKRTTPPKKPPAKRSNETVSVEEFEVMKQQLKKHKRILKQLLDEVSKLKGNIL